MEKLDIANKIGSVLFKATGDPHRYYLKLNTGEVICFFQAIYGGGDFILLNGIRDTNPPLKDAAGEKINVDRGIEVRLDQIAWVVDYEKPRI